MKKESERSILEVRREKGSAKGGYTGSGDIFRSALVKNACYDGELEIPCIDAQWAVPTKLLSFSKAIGGKEYDAWVHFYEADMRFERLWNRPERYLPALRKYAGVITPDFSVFRDMPLVMQQWNIYRSRAIGHWLQENGMPVITNVRWGDERTFELSCTGVPRGAAIAIGSHGCMKRERERKCFAEGLDYAVDRLRPQTLIVYGTAPDAIFLKHKQAGISVLQFDSECMAAHKKAVHG